MPGWHDVDESVLIEQAQQGNADAFGELYELYSPVVFRYLYSHVDDRLDAEDLNEEVFIRVWSSMPKFENQGVPFSAFLFRVARNALIDHYRKNNRNSPALSLNEAWVKDAHPDPAESLIKGSEHQEIRNTLNELRDDYRIVLDLRFLGELSPVETATVMGKSPGAVRVLQHRALNALRKLLLRSNNL